MSTDTKALEFTLSPAAVMDIIVLLEDFVPANEAEGSLKRLNIVLRQNGYQSFDALSEVAWSEIYGRLKDMGVGGIIRDDGTVSPIPGGPLDNGSLDESDDSFGDVHEEFGDD